MVSLQGGKSPLNIRGSNPTWKVANKCLNVRKQTEVVERDKRWSPPLSLLSCESPVSMKENPNRKKFKATSGRRNKMISFFSTDKSLYS